PPLLNLRFGMEAGGVAFDLVRPVRHRFVDRVDGEQTRALTVVPPVALNLPQDVVLLPNGDARRVEIEVHANVPKAAGDVRLAPDAGGGGGGRGVERGTGITGVRAGASRPAAAAGLRSDAGSRAGSAGVASRRGARGGPRDRRGHAGD